MLKFKLDTRGLAREIKDALKPVVKAAGAKTASKAAQKAKEIASSKLNTSLDMWEKGFALSDLGNGNYALTMNCKLANMIEDGIPVGAISKLIMEGNRARINKAEGKNYVDVPLKQKEDSPAVKVFRSADDLIKDVGKKDVRFSNPAKKNTKVEERFIRRFKQDAKAVTERGGIPGLMESRKAPGGKPMYLLIRRVNDKTVWPENPFPGARSFKEVSDKIEQYFEDALRSLL